MPAPYTGSCQCGSVRFEITAEPLTCYTCHCTDCQKQSGSAFGMAIVVPSDAFSMKGKTASFKKTAASGRDADCVFCRNCGGRIYHGGKGWPILLVKTGLLDNMNGIRPVANLWTQSKQSWVQIPEDMLNYETQPAEGLEALFERYKAEVG